MRAHAGHIAEKAEASETLEKSAVIALYDTHEEAQEAVRELERSGFDMQKLSIVGKDYQTEEVEMYGFSLTMYLLSGWLTRTCPGVDPFSYDFGHLWYTLVGFKGKPHMNPIHLASNLIILGGFILLSSAWRVLFEAQRDGKLATAGPYASVRHPQYVALMLVMFGFLLQWPTLVTPVMFPRPRDRVREDRAPRGTRRARRVRRDVGPLCRADPPVHPAPATWRFRRAETGRTCVSEVGRASEASRARRLGRATIETSNRTSSARLSTTRLMCRSQPVCFIRLWPAPQSDHRRGGHGASVQSRSSATRCDCGVSRCRWAGAMTVMAGPTGK